MSMFGKGPRPRNGFARAMWQRDRNRQDRTRDREEQKRVVRECRRGDFRNFRRVLWSLRKSDVQRLFGVTPEEFEAWTDATA